ncbi:MAG TPA: SUMF1/EgtB/PvdO family nonheme iron enzyme [Rudaea sp.]|nr:SUMF1/EgtB/PvdO family nonheme iron enzyme [Rudaea sp.]
MESVAYVDRPKLRLLQRLTEARRRTDALIERVGPGRLYQRPIPERHRFVFYLGHLEAFDWNLLHERLGLERTHAELDALFAFGIDPIDGRKPHDMPHDWPTSDHVIAYRRNVRRTLDAALGADPFRDPADGVDAPLEFLLEAAIEHRLMHAETLAYMLSQARGDRARRNDAPAGEPPAMRMVRIPGGRVELGAPRSGWHAFGWDNEFDAHDVTVRDFEMSKYMVTNGEFLEFMSAGGYYDSRYWSPSDWDWRRSEEIVHPTSWAHVDGAWYFRTTEALVPLPLDWPVYVSHAEASAYARFVGASLPTEAQWHRAAFGTHMGTERPYPWGHALPAARHGNFDFSADEPCAVDAHRAGDSAFGISGLLGNGWEWTSTPFAPFPGFRAFTFYPGYSRDFFDEHHYVLKGGSPFTAACMLRRSFRNWFQPHYPYVYAGFRCVRN